MASMKDHPCAKDGGGGNAPRPQYGPPVGQSDQVMTHDVTPTNTGIRGALRGYWADPSSAIGTPMQGALTGGGINPGTGAPLGFNLGQGWETAANQLTGQDYSHNGGVGQAFRTVQEMQRDPQVKNGGMGNYGGYGSPGWQGQGGAGVGGPNTRLPLNPGAAPPGNGGQPIPIPPGGVSDPGPLPIGVPVPPKVPGSGPYLPSGAPPGAIVPYGAGQPTPLQPSTSQLVGALRRPRNAGA